MKLIDAIALGLGGGAAVYALLAFLRPQTAQASEASIPEYKPKPSASKPVAPKPAAEYKPAVSTNLSETSNPDTIFLKYDLSDSFRLKSGKRFTIAPPWDPEHNTWARLDYADTERAFKRLGLRMMTADELDEIANRPDTLILVPPTLVHTAQDGQLMGTLQYWEKSDKLVDDQIDKYDWRGERPILFAKFWEKGAPAGYSFLHGMYIPKGAQPGGGYSGIIQNRGGRKLATRHNNRHRDYSSALMGVEL